MREGKQVPFLPVTGLDPDCWFMVGGQLGQSVALLA